MNDEKKKSLDQAILQIEKQFGKGSIMKYGDASSSKFTDPNLQVKPQLRFISLPKLKRKTA